MDLESGVTALATDVTRLADELRRRAATVRTTTIDGWTGAAARAERRRRDDLATELNGTVVKLDDLAAELRAHARAAQTNYDEFVDLLNQAKAAGEKAIEKAVELGYPTLITPRLLP